MYQREEREEGHDDKGCEGEPVSEKEGKKDEGTMRKGVKGVNINKSK